MGVHEGQREGAAEQNQGKPEHQLLGDRGTGDYGGRNVYAPVSQTPARVGDPGQIPDSECQQAVAQEPDEERWEKLAVMNP